MKVNWATSPGNQPKTDTSQHHHIFVGDLSPEIETDTLRGAFAPFGEISNCRIVRDPHTLRSKGYAFVSFVKKAEAENAIHSMNGQYLGSRSIRTNWSTRKPPAPRESIKVGGKIGKTPNYEEIYNQTSPTNTTVYCGGFPQNFITDELIHKHFGQFGTIQDTRVFKDKGYAFIKFTSKDAATHAIEGTHNQEVNGHSVKCFWGKENGGDMSANSGMIGLGGQQNLINNNLAYHAIAPQHHQPHQATQQPQQPPQTHSNPSPQLTQAAAQYPYNYQQMGYWYPVCMHDDRSFLTSPINI
jgi:nucleolysin TIA-1/TIAR